MKNLMLMASMASLVTLPAFARTIEVSVDNLAQLSNDYQLNIAIRVGKGKENEYTLYRSLPKEREEWYHTYHVADTSNSSWYIGVQLRDGTSLIPCTVPGSPLSIFKPTSQVDVTVASKSSCSLTYS